MISLSASHMKGYRILVRDTRLASERKLTVLLQELNTWYFSDFGVVLFEVTEANHIPELNNSTWVL